MYILKIDSVYVYTLVFYFYRVYIIYAYYHQSSPSNTIK